ncbi:hypothetical protein HOU02_gp307 [Caulobacter phage CcrBL9]|uniref:Uncharacterized protein n=1 Tax=Caulobacter phage CcrBL9 TaxID=2283270 RepID=A0A385EF69_9CAUD|nr:hypothetical protein HOU02_gp307 [Caulobacter phage CcrBL9]AXQ69418.1 hypothetical protein CcrBL9_gp394 [Caulobacter phage CcrBL9]
MLYEACAFGYGVVTLRPAPLIELLAFVVALAAGVECWRAWAMREVKKAMQENG